MSPTDQEGINPFGEGFALGILLLLLQSLNAIGFEVPHPVEGNSKVDTEF